MRHNQFMLLVDHHLDVVADIHPHRDRHRSAVRIGERDLGFAALCKCLLHLLVVLLALAELRDAFLQLSGCQVRASWGLGVGGIKCLEVLSDLLINVLKCFREFLSGEIALAIVDSLKLAAIDRDEFATEQV